MRNPQGWGQRQRASVPLDSSALLSFSLWPPPRDPNLFPVAAVESGAKVLGALVQMCCGDFFSSHSPHAPFAGEAARDPCPSGQECFYPPMLPIQQPVTLRRFSPPTDSRGRFVRLFCFLCPFCICP